MTDRGITDRYHRRQRDIPARSRSAKSVGSNPWFRLHAGLFRSPGGAEIRATPVPTLPVAPTRYLEAVMLECGPLARQCRNQSGHPYADELATNMAVAAERNGAWAFIRDGTVSHPSRSGFARDGPGAVAHHHQRGQARADYSMCGRRRPAQDPGPRARPCLAVGHCSQCVWPRSVDRGTPARVPGWCRDARWRNRRRWAHLGGQDESPHRRLEPSLHPPGPSFSALLPFLAGRLHARHSSATPSLRTNRVLRREFAAISTNNILLADGTRRT